jgi:hypothetical protein
VHLLKPANQPNGSWQARLKLADGTTMIKSFSVLKYGERKAFALAVAARRRMLEMAEDRPFVHDPLARRFASRHKPINSGAIAGCSAEPSRGEAVARSCRTGVSVR